MTQTYHIDSVLVERFAHGNGTVFVGAGISLGARLPSWGELMNDLRADLGTEISASTDYQHIAELYETKHNRSVLVQYLKERLGDVRFQLTKTHELIVGLPVQRIYTTNFDTLLEQASQKKQINRNVIVNASHVGFSDTSTLSIVKLHGDLSDPNSIVISARDYYSYFENNPAVVDLLKVELQTHTVLFLGYSFSDPNLGMILGSAALQSGPSRPLLYSLQFNPSPLAIQLMHARGVKVIPLNAASHTPEAELAVEEWLRSFRQSLISFERRRNRSVPDESSPHKQAVPAGRKNAVRRQKMSDRIKAGLNSDFRVVVVKGEAGIGKTQLVAEAAADALHSVGTFMSDEAFERTVWIKASFDVAPVGHQLEGILDAIASKIDTLLSIEGADDAVKQETETHEHWRKRLLRKKQAEINVILQERRLLVVIEDLENPAPGEHGGSPAAADDQRLQFNEIKEWLENSGPYANPRSRIIVTSRSAIVAGFVVEIAKLDSKEATELLRDHERTIMLRRYCPGFHEKHEKELLNITTGNPQAIKLALGLCNGTGTPTVLNSLASKIYSDHWPSEKIEHVFSVLVTDILDQVKEAGDSAADVVIAMTVFPTEEWVPAAMLQKAAQTSSADVAGQRSFKDIAQRCVRFGLMERDASTDTYFLPRIVREVLLEKEHQPHIDGISEPFPVNAARNRLAGHLLAFIEIHACREDIEEPYWNALVCDEMARIDSCWQIIDAVMHRVITDDRTGAKGYAVKFAMLMVHYMDSRFLNSKRMKYVRMALDALDQAAPTPEQVYARALLHIDALGWTFIEEGANQRAREEIGKGLKLLRKIRRNRDELIALAFAWCARINAFEGRNVDAAKNIRRAFQRAYRVPEKTWILQRVEMVAGDVELMDNRPEKARTHYQKAADCAEQHGGEGDGYQINHRIGLAMLKRCEQYGTSDRERLEKADLIDKARRYFTQLIENSHVATGRLYGQYGMARISAQENLTAEAKRQLQQIQKEILHRSKGNVLLKMVEKSYQNLDTAGKRSG